MKVVHVLLGAPMSMGGAERHLLELATYQHHSGIEVLVVTNSNSELSENLQSAGVDTFGLKDSWRYNFLTNLKLRKLIKREDPDIIHSHKSKSAQICGAIMKSLPRPILVSTAHTLVKGDHFRFADFVICVSGKVLDSLMLKRFPKTHAITIRNWVLAERFQDLPSKSKIRKHIGVDGSTLLLVLLGRLEKVKGHDTALTLLSELLSKRIDTKLLFIGDGSLQSMYRRKVANMGLANQVIFYGFSSVPEQVLPAGDILLMPSRKEGLPLALMEGMMCGLVPVAFSVGGIPEVIHHGVNGFLAEPENLSQLVEPIGRLHANETMRCELAENARETIMSNFISRRAFQEVDKVYASVLKADRT
jgi:glycosyltransferase involved in cell wall biosynthesis